MATVEEKIRYLSPSQLLVLFFLAKSEKGVESSVTIGKKIGKEGKSLGAIFSSLVRRKIRGSSLILPWGKDASGHGLRFKLNEKLISKKRLLAITKELLD